VQRHKNSGVPRLLQHCNTWAFATHGDPARARETQRLLERCRSARILNVEVAMSTHLRSGVPAAPQRIAVFGLGYVGGVCASCLADLGHEVIGVDVVAAKVDLLNSGQSPVLEAGLNESIQRGIEAGRLRATSDAADAVANSELAFICVGTPSLPNGDHDLEYLRRVADIIGRALGGRVAHYGVVGRITVLPETSGQVFGVASNPEFLREGAAIADFRNPPFTVVGTSDARLRDMLRETYRKIEAPFFATEIRVAEILKLVCNAFHAVKIVFANEVGTLCKEFGVDSRAVMDLFVQDRKLNVSEKYLRPGFAFGGSCLPKDLRALSRIGRRCDAELPLLDSVLRSNELHVHRAVRLVESTGDRKVAVLGLTFKPGTDDLRESPVVELAQTLLGRGYELQIYDPHLNVARLTGANKRFIDQRIPHLSRLLVKSAEEAVRASEIVVVAYEADEFRAAVASMNGSHHLIDLAGIDATASAAGYEGIAW
jgi:GDP-mannose 6-dehydrogenase